MCGTCGCQTPEKSHRWIVVEKNLLDGNDRMAAHVREHLAARRVLALNLVSSPGAGKTTLLVETLRRLAGRVPVAVIEGDQQTSIDADRIAATGVPAVQVNTGTGCHLDATMVHDVLHGLDLPEGGILFLENVGNLVCPAMFDLGESARVVVISVPEGDDKPAKYPHIFAGSRLMVVNKTDLLPYVDFDVDRCLRLAREQRPDLEDLRVSARTGEGLDAWIAWLLARRDEVLVSA